MFSFVLHLSFFHLVDLKKKNLYIHLQCAKSPCQSTADSDASFHKVNCFVSLLLKIHCFIYHYRPPSEEQDNDTDEDRQDIVTPRYIGVNQGQIYLGPPRRSESTKDRVILIIFKILKLNSAWLLLIDPYCFELQQFDQ